MIVLHVASADAKGTLSSRYPPQPAASESSDDTYATVRRIQAPDKWVVSDSTCSDWVQDVLPPHS
jgi:hypothetical protein